jgi:hypothetical protein
MAHAHDLGNGVHRQALGVGSTDRLVPLLAQGFAGLLKLGFALGVALGEGRQAGSGLGCLAFSPWDGRIV